MGSWKVYDDQRFGFWVKKMKILGVFFGVIDVQRDNWEPKLSKLDKMLTLWKSRSLSMVDKSLIINALGVSYCICRKYLSPLDGLMIVIIALFGIFSWGLRLSLLPERHSIVQLTGGVLGL